MHKEKRILFLPDYLKVQVDSTVTDHQVDLIVKVKKLLAQTQYRINDYRISQFH
jgi:hypothetical protein